MSDSPVSLAADDFSAFKNALRPRGEIMVLPEISEKPNVYVRKCYERLFDDILDLVSLGFTFIHISGTPGIGKSCFLWYVLTRLLNEEQGKAVIVQLVEKLQIRTYVFTPEGTVEPVASPEMSNHYGQDGTWLLTDQKYVGSRARKGATVLFASPKVENWDEARRILNESKFKRLYMRPWSIKELDAVFFSKRRRNARYYREFWVRYYMAGPIARWYSIPLKDAFSEISDALLNVVKLGTVDATLFRGGMDNGQHSHKIFCAWPSDDFTEVSQFTFISEWTELSFAIACYRGSLGNWMTNIQVLASDPQLRSAAGTLFERYAHYRLSRGGVFPSRENPDIKLELERRSMMFFDGNSLLLNNAKPLHEFYLRPNSSSFPVIDSVYLPNVMFQVSIAMKKSHFDNLCSQLTNYSREHPEAASGIRGVSSDQPWIVLVKMRGDNSTQSTGLSLVEDMQEPEEEQAPRKRRRYVSTVKQEKTAPARKAKQQKTFVQFQTTIVLGEDETAPVDYEEQLQEVYNTVRSRLVGNDDPGHLRLKDYTSHELGSGESIHLLMRRGKQRFAFCRMNPSACTGCCSKQYNEFEGDLCVFGVWVEAFRSQAEEDGEYTTVVNMECTVGTFLDEDYREIDVFIDERVGSELRYDDPVELDVTLGSHAVHSSEDDTVTARLLSATVVSVAIVSESRECKYFRLRIRKP